MINRRQFNQWLGSLSVGLGALGRADAAPEQERANNFPLPTIGMGTWITFDHNPPDSGLQNYVDILNAFFAAGGRMIDSSPMYGSAQQLLGRVLPLANSDALYAATKVWIPGRQMGIEQMQQSAQLWGRPIDLMYVHNLLDWKNHLPTLRAMKQAGVIKHLGVTTSHGRRHDELMRIMGQERLDFIQVSYNIHDRQVEQRLLPMAMDLGIQVVINRPFQTGGLFTRVAGSPLPDFASDIQCQHWSQFFLKFVTSHPAVSCTIPATSQLSHMQQNMAAMSGDVPDAAMRQEMAKYYRQITA